LDAALEEKEKKMESFAEQISFKHRLRGDFVSK